MKSYASGSKALGDVGQGFIREIQDGFAYLSLDEALGKLFSRSIVGEREINLFVEESLSLLHGCVVRLICAGYYSYSVAFNPELVLLEVCDNLLHPHGHRNARFFLLGFHSAEYRLPVVYHNNRGLEFLCADNH